MNHAAAGKADLQRLWKAKEQSRDPSALADQQHHDAVAKTYDNWESVPWMSDAEAWIVPWMVAHAHRGIVVDFGTGTGRIAQALANTGSIEVIAVDHSMGMLAVTLAKTQGQPVLALQADVSKLPILDASVDTVMCSGILHHLPKPELAVAEAARILRPGGRIVIREPNAEYPAGWFEPLERVAEIVHTKLSSRSRDGNCDAGENNAPSENPVSLVKLREWLRPMYVPEFLGSAKLFASLSLPVGTWGENNFYRFANWADRAYLLRLLPRRGSLLLAVAKRIETSL